MRVKTIIVTGGAGFLGSHLCDYLVARGHNVKCVDNFQTGLKENIAHLLTHPRFEVLEHDVVEPLDVAADEIYNLACPASPVHYQSDPVKTMRSSVLGALHLLDLAHRRSAKILQTSTSEVYGDPAVHPQPETYWGNVNPTGLRACYDEGKRAAEAMFFDYKRQYGVHTKVVRLFNTYGPRMRPDDGRVISNFIVQALRGEDLTVYGDGSQTRSFCYVDDLVPAMVRMMETTDNITGPVNLGNPHEFTILELARKVVALTGARSRIAFRPLPADDPKQRRPDITLAQQLLGGWEPEVMLDAGLPRTVDYFRSILQGQDAI